MTSLGDDEDIPELVEALEPPAETTEPSGSGKKSDSAQKVPITVVTGLDTYYRAQRSILIEQDILGLARLLSSTTFLQSNMESE